MVARYLKILACLYLFLMVAGCSILPEYARPRMFPVEAGIGTSSEGFTYRQLKIADFRASSLPEALGDHEKQIQAHSCTHIRPSEDTRFKIVPNFYHGKVYYFGSIEHISFQAFMIPSCSWWNPRMPKKRTNYVLQHEQIHFAITELAARTLIRQAKGTTATFLVVQPTWKQAFNEISAKIKSLVKAATDESLKEHTAFDEDTSMIFDPARQRWWLDRVNKAMREDQTD